MVYLLFFEVAEMKQKHLQAKDKGTVIVVVNTTYHHESPHCPCQNQPELHPSDVWSDRRHGLMD